MQATLSHPARDTARQCRFICPNPGRHTLAPALRTYLRMKMLRLNPLHALALLGLSFTTACGADPGTCFGATGQQTCVYEICDDNAACHFEVHAQAMTKADLIDYLYKRPGLDPKDPLPPPPPPKKK